MALTCNELDALGWSPSVSVANIAWSNWLMESLRISMASSHSFCPGHLVRMEWSKAFIESVTAFGDRKIGHYTCTLYINFFGKIINLKLFLGNWCTCTCTLVNKMVKIIINILILCNLHVHVLRYTKRKDIIICNT